MDLVFQAIKNTSPHYTKLCCGIFCKCLGDFWVYLGRDIFFLKGLVKLRGIGNIEDLIIIIIIVAANRPRKVQQRRSSTRSNRKYTMAPLAAAIRSMCDLGAQLTASWNRLYAGFCRGGKTGEPGEKPSKLKREPIQTQPSYGVWSTLVGGECSHHCAIPAPNEGWKLEFEVEN